MTDERRSLTYDDFWGFQIVSDPQVSPDGGAVAYVVSHLDQVSDEQRSAIWHVDLNSGATKQLTAGTKRDWNPQWSQDGRSLAFVSTREGDHSQIFVMDMDGGEARRVTDRTEAAYSPVWCPDGLRLAFLADIASDEQRTTRDVAWKAGRKEGDDRAEARHLRTLKYRADGRGYHDKRSHLVMITLDGSEERQLTSGDVDDTQPAWSPDGTTIAFVSNRTGSADRNFAADVWTVDVESMECIRLTDGTVSAASPVWSPDGESLAFSATPEWITEGTQNRHLWLVGRAGGDQRDLCPEFDGTMGHLIGDYGPASTLRPQWSHDGRYIFTTFSMGGSELVHRIPVEGGTPQRVTEGDVGVEGYGLRRNTDEMIVCAATCAHPLDLFRAACSGGPLVSLTHHNASLLDTVDIAQAERFSVTASDGEEVDGWLVRPVRDTGQPTPLVLLVHGGPHSMYGNTFYFNVQVLAGAGIACVYFNPRGSSGYGSRFMRDVVLDWGGKPFDELMTGIDRVVDMGDIDQQRIAVTGGSYGGYMTCWALGHTNRFACGVAINPVVNLQSFWGTSDIGPLWCTDQLGGAWWEFPERYREMSPLTHSAQVKSPLLFIHAEQDNRVPISQSEEMYAALHVLGVETELVRIPNASHGLANTAAPRHRIDRWILAKEWFERHWQRTDTT